MAGSRKREIVFNQRRHRFKEGQRPAVVPVMGRFAPVHAVQRRQLLVGTSPNDTFRASVLDDIRPRGRPFRTPRVDEPVIPEAVDIGAAVLGRLLDERSVHRPDIAAQIAGAKIGDEVTPESAATVLMSPDGGRKGVPESAEFAVLVSGARRNPERLRALASRIDGRALLWDAESGVLDS